MAITNTYNIGNSNRVPLIRTRDRTDRVTLIHHLAVNTITPLVGNSVNFQDKVDFGLNEIALTEMTPEPPKFDNVCIIFVENNGGGGGGKTRLMAKFFTGAAQQLAIEP